MFKILKQQNKWKKMSDKVNNIDIWRPQVLKQRSLGKTPQEITDLLNAVNDDDRQITNPVSSNFENI